MLNMLGVYGLSLRYMYMEDAAVCLHVTSKSCSYRKKAIDAATNLTSWAVSFSKTRYAVF